MSEQKTILMILNQKFLPDIRVEQEYEALIKNGYRVFVVANEDGFNNKNYEIIRLNPFAKWSQIFNLSLSYNPILKNLIVNELKKRGIKYVDVIHVHDLLWSFLGLQLKKHYKGKLIIDLHENYPEAIRDMITERSFKNNDTFIYKIIEVACTITRPRNIINYLSKWAISVKRLIRYENKMLQKCDRFIVVVDEALERFKNKEFFKKGVVVSNTKDPEIWKFLGLPEIKTKLVICYVGSVQNLRGLDTAILAMKHLSQKEYELNIVGIIANSQIYKYFKYIIDKNNITNVNLIEWLANENDAFKYINDAHICIVPHKDTGLTQTTVPHKLFMYMAVGRPVLVSDVAPLKRIVNNAGNGLIFRANDPLDFANKIKQLKDESRLPELARNGRYAAENMYNWLRDKERLLTVYSELLSKD